MDAIVAVLTRTATGSSSAGTRRTDRSAHTGDPRSVAAGALVGTGHLSAALALALAGAASLALIRRGTPSDGVEARACWASCVESRSSPIRAVSRTQRIFTRHGARSLLVAKFIQGSARSRRPSRALSAFRFVSFSSSPGSVACCGLSVRGRRLALHRQLEIIASPRLASAAGRRAAGRDARRLHRWK